jgi:hypothetical protein
MLSAPVQPAPAIPGVFYQTHPAGTPVRLDVMAQETGPREFHFYVGGVDFADVASILSPVVAGTQALIFKMPPALLNPNYWEPHTREAEAAMRAAGAYIITRDDRGASWLWRADTIAPGRYLRDGIDVIVEKVPGAAFKIAGPELIKLGKAWAASGGDAKDRFEWVAFKPSAPRFTAADAQEDLSSIRLRTEGVVMLFAATGDRNVRMVFSDRVPSRACARAALRGYMMRCAGRVVSPPNDTVCDQFQAQARRGLTSIPDKDFVSKGTAFEFTARPRLTPWSEGWLGDEDPGEERILVYYDRVAGIWAVAS